MSNQPQTSAELRALDLPRVNLDAMTDEELDLHRDEVVATIHDLSTVLAGRPMRIDIARDIEGRRRRLRLHLARLLDLRNARQAVRGMLSVLRSQSGSSSGGGTQAPQA